MNFLLHLCLIISVTSYTRIVALFQFCNIILLLFYYHHIIFVTIFISNYDESSFSLNYDFFFLTDYCSSRRSLHPKEDARLFLYGRRALCNIVIRSCFKRNNLS